MDILNAWLDDLPQQFQGKELIEGLISTFAKQLEEIQGVFDQLDTKTDLNSAVGKNLDMVGEGIVNLSRKDAHIILRKSDNTEITDEIYRKVLRYKSIQNSCDCTYEEIMEAISMIWDTKNIYYYENPERPATIFLSLPTVSMDAIDPSVGRVLGIKAAGVALLYTIKYWTLFNSFISNIIRFPKLVLKWKFIFFSFVARGGRCLDGTWLLDGSALLNSSILDVPVAIKYSGIVFQYDESIQCSVITRKNIWYLDGSNKLDGARFLNATEKKEVL